MGTESLFFYNNFAAAGRQQEVMIPIKIHLAYEIKVEAHSIRGRQMLLLL